MELPFDGAISAFFKDGAPDEVRNAIKRADKGDILNTSYPHPERIARKVYEAEMAALHNDAVRKTLKLSRILKKQGVTLPAASGTGGPLIELKGASDFMATVSKLDATLETLDKVRRAARALPHGSGAHQCCLRQRKLPAFEHFAPQEL